MEQTQSSLGEFESTLKKHAKELVDSLERGKFGDAVQLIHQLNQTRDLGLYQEVGKLTRELHSAIVSFQIDPHMPQAEEVSQITDATERLSYVVKLTEGAA
ncbi:protein phosphatase, partial [Pseudomonas frederiksbergensis]|nr:protein phosphatase [Pseudomonas frederiksbergensis]